MRCLILFSSQTCLSDKQYVKEEIGLNSFQESISISCTFICKSPYPMVFLLQNSFLCLFFQKTFFITTIILSNKNDPERYASRVDTPGGNIDQEKGIHQFYRQGLWGNSN